MTGYDLYRRVEALLGYYDDGIRHENEGFSGETLVWINQILSDLGCREIASPVEEIGADNGVKEALAAGVAMLMALAVADMTKAHKFEELYRKKRATALSSLSCISDTLPSPGEE